MVRTGRPPKAVEKKRERQIGSEIQRRYPTVATLLYRLTYDSFGEHQAASSLLDDAIKEIEHVVPSGFKIPKSPTLEDKIRFVSDRIGGLSQTSRLMGDLRDTIESELSRVRLDLELAKLELLRLVIQRPSMSEYATDLIQQLQAAGMTRAKGGRPSSAQVAEIMQVLERGKERRPTLGIKPAPVDLPARPLTNPWLAFPEELEHYNLVRKDISRDPSLENKSMLQMELPPFGSLQEFGVPHLYQSFLEANDSMEKEKIAWSICEFWRNKGPRKSHYDPGRRAAWMFLLGTKHGFAHEIPKLKTVKFPSPWKQGEFVIAQRTRSSPRGETVS